MSAMQNNHSHTEQMSTLTLRRARAGRWIAGVCKGIAIRWNIPVLRVRLLFAIATGLFGVGILAYVAFWLALPADDDDESSSLLKGLAYLAFLVAVLAGLATIATAATTAALFGFGWVAAGAAIVFLVMALILWPMLKPAWILLPLIAVVIPVVGVKASKVEIAPQVGLSIVSPGVPREIPKGGYQTGLGDLLVDLRKLHAPRGATVPVRLDTGVGDTVVALPDNRCFNLSVRYKIGSRFVRALGYYNYAAFYGNTSLNTEGHWQRQGADPKAPTLMIDYNSVSGGLSVRDYPANVGPLYDTEWPYNVEPPLSPGERRWAWRKGVRRPAVQRRWRKWHRQMARFERNFARLKRGFCARENTGE